MLIEIRKVNFSNKGAQLMLYSILEKVKEKYPAARFAMQEDNKPGFREKAEKLGILIKAKPKHMFLKMSPHHKEYVSDVDIDVVLDAAGFAYGDIQWSLRCSRELALSCKTWKKNGTKVILLPQAFGPFSSRKIKDGIKTLSETAILIFARESVSYKHLTDVTGKRPHISIAPDFTNLTAGTPPDNFDMHNHRICVVPNKQMIEKTSKAVSTKYLSFMVDCARILLEKNARPFLLVHAGGKDLALSRKIAAGFYGKLPVVRESDPLKLKGIIGTCEGAVMSRFHALVSALSQGVPSLATGWSHKYLMLMEEYGFAEGLVDIKTDKEYILGKLNLITDGASRKRVKETITAKSAELKNLSEKMWERVFDVINGVK